MWYQVCILTLELVYFSANLTSSVKAVRELAEKVQERVAGILSLRAEDAVYHKDCFFGFSKGYVPQSR